MYAATEDAIDNYRFETAPSKESSMCIFSPFCLQSGQDGLARWKVKCGKTGAKKSNICWRSSGTQLALVTSGDSPTFASEAVEVGPNDTAVFRLAGLVMSVCTLRT